MAQARFNFVGTVMLPKEDSKRPFVKEVEKNGTKMLILNFGVKESNSNMAFVGMFGSEQKVIKTRNTDNEDIEVAWNDRFDEEILKVVSSMRKTTVDLGADFGGRKEFLSTYDAIEYIRENLPKYNGKICVVGQYRKTWYNDRYLDNFDIQHIYAAEEDRKSRLTINIDLYYNRNCVDKDDWKSDKVIAINGYIPQYINKDEGIKYVPQRVVLNASKYREDNERHMQLLNYKLKYVDISHKNMQHVIWECVLIDGAEEVEFDESQLTPSQKEQLELGIRTLEDFKPKGQIFGDRITEVRLFDPKLTGEFADGLVDTEMTETEFEEDIYVPAKDEKLDDVVKKAEAKKEESELDISEDDLF